MHQRKEGLLTIAERERSRIDRMKEMAALAEERLGHLEEFLRQLNGGPVTVSGWMIPPALLSQAFDLLREQYNRDR